MLPSEEGKAKKDLEDNKSIFSNKSAKTIKSLTKQVKNLKKLVSALQAHQEDSDADSSLSIVEGDTWLCIPICFGSGPASFSGIPENSVKFPDSVGTHVGIKSFRGKNNLFRNPPES
jgi:hypothetical protein